MRWEVGLRRPAGASRHLMARASWRGGAGTHTFPSEISRLSKLRNMSLYRFLASGAAVSPGERGCEWVWGTTPLYPLPPGDVWRDKARTPQRACMGRR